VSAVAVSLKVRSAVSVAGVWELPVLALLLWLAASSASNTQSTFINHIISRVRTTRSKPPYNQYPITGLFYNSALNSTQLKFIENGSQMAKRIQNTVHKNKSNDVNEI